MAEPIEATPTLVGKEAISFLKKMRKKKRLSKADKKILEIIKSGIFDDWREKKFNCFICGKSMVKESEWIYSGNCEHMKGIKLSVG